MNKITKIILAIVVAGLVLYAAPSVVGFLSASLSSFNINGSVFYYSFDAGDNFAKNSQGLAFGGINNLIFAPDKSIFAATSQGLFKTDQAGEKWERVADETGFLRSPVAVQQIIFFGEDFSRILIAAYKSNFGRIYLSDDGLKTLKEVYGVSNAGAVISDLKFDSQKNRIYFTSTEGVFGYSDDGGESFGLLKQFSDSLTKIVFNQKNGQGIFLVSPTSLYSSFDDGYYFTDLSNVLAAYSISGLNDLWLSEKNGLFLASNSGAWRSFDYGYTWQKMDSLLPRDLPAMAIMYNNERGEILIGFGGRLYFSGNGRDWGVRSLNQSNVISNIKVDPVNSDVILIGMRR